MGGVEDEKILEGLPHIRSVPELVKEKTGRAPNEGLIVTSGQSVRRTNSSSVAPVIHVASPPGS